MKSNVIFYIFAGREKFMRILLKYVNVLLRLKIISEVHIWDYTRNADDKKYIYDVCESTDNYILNKQNLDLNQIQ